MPVRLLFLVLVVGLHSCSPGPVQGDDDATAADDDDAVGDDDTGDDDDDVGDDDDDAGDDDATPVDCDAAAHCEGAQSVANTTGLANVSLCRTIGGSLSLAGLDEVELPCLESIGEDLWIEGDATIERLSLPALVTVGQNVEVSENTALIALDIPLLTSVGADLDISGNAFLPTVELPRLVSVGEDVTFSHNVSSTRIELDELAHVEGNLTVGGYNSSINPWLEEFHAPALATVNGQLFIAENTSLATVGLGSLNYVGGLALYENPSLVELDLPALVHADEGVTIAVNTALQSFRASNLLTVGGTLSITDLDALTDLDLASLEQVEGDVHVWGNAILPALDLPALVYVLSDFQFYYWFDGPNPELARIHAPNLAYIGSTLDIEGAASLVDLDLSSLYHVQQYFSIVDNDLLGGLEGLSGLHSVYLSVTIEDNACLSQEEAEAFAESVDAGWGASVSGNTGPCPP